MLNDVRYALRQLRRSPGFTLAAILSLALGIGANSAIFSLLDQVLLRVLPVREPSRLVLLDWEGPVYSINQGVSVLSHPMYGRLRDGNQVFSGVLARNREWFGVRYNGQSERVGGEFVSGNYFDVLGVGAAIGRTLSAADHDAVAVLSYDFWTTRFHSDPAVLGSTIFIDGTAFTIVGVSEEGFNGVELGMLPKVRIPVEMHDRIMPAAWTSMFSLQTDGRWLQVYGRLKPGVSLDRAKTSLQPLFHSMLDDDLTAASVRHAIAFTRDDAAKASLNVIPAAHGASFMRTYFRPALTVLMAIVGFVLLIACANVANLLLARAAGREREMTARLALGAGRARLIRQTLVESTILSGCGGALGLLFALWSDRILLRMFPAGAGAEALSASPDPRILLFTLAVSIATGVLFGIVPAMSASRADLMTALKENARTATGGHARFRRVLAFAQVFLCALLLIGAGLFVRSLRNLSTVDPGFRASNVLAFSVDPTLNGYPAVRTRQVLYDILDRLRGTGGIHSAGFGIIRVLDDWWGSPLTIEGYQPKPGVRAWAVNNGVSPGYFATLGIRVLEGRDFTEADGSSKHKVAVVNQTFARKFFDDRSPVGRHLGYGADPGTKMDLEIIGVVNDSKYGELREATLPQVFVNAGQIDGILRASYYVKTRGAPEAMFASIRKTVSGVDPNIAVFGTLTMNQELDNQVSTERIVATLASVFGALAAFLAAVGLYGLLAFTVIRRTREFGIRIALGARRGNVVWLVVKDVIVLALLGIGAAIPAAIGLMRVAQSQLYGIEASNPWNMAAAAAGLFAITVIAAYIPALRATRIDPVNALRHE